MMCGRRVDLVNRRLQASGESWNGAERADEAQCQAKYERVDELVHVEAEGGLGGRVEERFRAINSRNYCATSARPRRERASESA